jgi:hypothetical protein
MKLLTDAVCQELCQGVLGDKLSDNLKWKTEK